MDTPFRLEARRRLVSLEDTRRLGALLARWKRPSPTPEEQDRTAPQEVILLWGELGTGKTTLVKALAAALGIAEEVVISPTYTLVNVYQPLQRRPSEQRSLPLLYHVDLFRLAETDDLLEFDPQDWLNPQGLTCIEWPQIALPLLEERRCLQVRLGTVADRPVTGAVEDASEAPLTREARLEASDPYWQPLFTALDSYGSS